MKKKQLHSLKLNKKIISAINKNNLKGGGPTVGTDCVSHCLGWECPDHK
ncbi:hypothetical protein C8N46_102318 [Kordia periserrulae]|uniref:Uncharacterized protein n=1 Tax=Kordia periserrulae TaxID=701523 RepID=A0A2T6C3S4_9FLAO|nr:hypothetical protein [Kordia periserrulae]PTX62917.1 hypothetical protein C8N46_102318 [Kordia periserrulae]